MNRQQPHYSRPKQLWSFNHYALVARLRLAWGLSLKQGIVERNLLQPSDYRLCLTFNSETVLNLVVLRTESSAAALNL